MGSNEIIYSEKQRFRQWWMWIILIGTPISGCWLIIRDIILGSPSGDPWILIISGLLGVGFSWFMYYIGLDTIVTNVGVCIRFRPFHRKWVVFSFDEIEKAEAVTYRPIREYGGWGIRYGWKGKAYNVSGNKGVLLTPKEGKTTMIGSQNHETLGSIINERLQ
tara:strand:- start:1951 stop:2439 length:489 start_codon:yes stop_codon:yes gene_type:complete